MISWLKKPEKLNVYIRYMLQGHSLRECAKLTGISLQTSFDWRHKVLTAIGKFNSDVSFTGIVESDEMFVAHSEKGRIRKVDIEKALKGKIADGSTLCTDSHRSYTAFSKGNLLKHIKINASKGQIVKDIYHVQHVNRKIAGLRDFIRTFKGVSTKYLQNYLNWYAVTEKLMKTTIPAIAAIEMAVQSKTAWQDFILLRSNTFNI